MSIFTNNRREFIKLLGLGGAVFASGLPGVRAFAGKKTAGAADDFFFVQLSDTHWGFSGPPNPEAENTLKEAVARVNALPQAPDFIVFTGDLTHTTDDAAVRRKRMAEFKQIVSRLKVTKQYTMPGEHDASLDAGKAYQESFGRMHYSFNHKGIHFAVLDNVSDPEAKLGDAQIDWLRGDLKGVPADAPIVIFTHRPLFDLAHATGKSDARHFHQRTGAVDPIDVALAREVFDLIHDHPRIAVGYARTLHNPMMRAERLIARLVDDAKESAQLMRRRQRQKDKDLLQELILGEGLTPVYQPIVHLSSGEIFGYESLTRGPRRSPLEAPPCTAGWRRLVSPRWAVRRPVTCWRRWRRRLACRFWCSR